MAGLGSAAGYGASAPAYGTPAAAGGASSALRGDSNPGIRQLLGFLVSFHNNNAGIFWPLRSGRTLVGRAGAADGLEIEVSDAATSTNHAVFHGQVNPPSLAIEDIGSTNGTFVNEEKLAPNTLRELRDGDRVRLGGYICTLRTLSR